MNQYLKSIQDLLQQYDRLTEQEKEVLIKAITDADKQWSITDFKLDRTEKVKKTTAILLEETISELEQKRKAVEAQNRELEIESALERVRSVAMGMKKPGDMLDVCKTISQQLELLHIKEIRNIQTAIFYEAKSIYINYEFYPKHDKLLITEVDYNNHPVAEDFADRMRKGPNQVWTHEFKGEEVRDWLTYQKTTNVFIDSYLEKANSLNYYWYSLGPVALGISTYSPLNEEEINLFKRFRNVFELAYRRYIDIEKAEAQAREAQIELALERVRARTMAMQKSGELTETSLLLFQQFKDLGETSEQISIGIFNEGKNIMQLYSTLYGSQWKEAARVDLNEPVVMKKIHAAWREQKKSLVIDLAGKDLREYNAFRKKLSNLEYREDRWVIHIAFFSKGVLTFSTTEPHPQETIQLLERFAGVFDQTYTRFLDLQKAEAQAREAKTEAALERVRARTMAMQKSEELKDAAALLFQQVKSLGVPAYSCGYNIWEKNEKKFTSWMSTQDGSDFNAVLNIPLTEDANFIRFADSRQKGEPFFVLELRGERMQEHYQYLKSIPAFKAYFDYAVSVGFDLPETQIHHVANFSQGNLLFITLEPCPEFHDVFKRFAAVFEQTYTRFLDLQKAEAQAREAQIEVALERVRARAMAMHKSDDLKLAVATVFEELDKLNLGLIRCGIAILDKEKPRGDIWITIKSDRGNTIQVSGDEPLDIHPLLKGAYNAWLKQEDFYYVLQNEDLLNYYQAITKTNFQLPVSATFNTEKKDQQQYYFNAVFQDGSLFAFLDTAFTDEAKMVMKRFASVFNLTYKRFLDLQKAEAQAREAQIEVSLERVRSKTMAMHNSQDVGDTVSTMFDELVKLGVETVRCGVGILHEPNQMEVWTAKKSENEKAELIIGRLDMTIHPLLQGMYKGWKNKDITFSYELKGKDLVDYFTVLINSPEYHISYDIASLPQQQFHNDFYFSEGALFAFSAEQLSTEASQIFKRFAGVFGQTYRRYLDLQKAEANTREAQIEAGLERVRARTMAMHSSEDVSSATATMFTELEKLGIENVRGGITNISRDQTQEVWSVNNMADGKTIKAVGIFDMNAHPFWQLLYKGWENKEDFLHYYLAGKDKEDYIKILNATPNYLTQPIQQFPDINIQSYYFGEGAVWTFSLKPHSEEDRQVMKRFTSVFSLTFRRYQDLKKAEAQAREATIEAALEKVRGKAMAMHNSNDLSVTASMVFTELRKLGINSIRCGVGLLSKETRKAQLYSATSSTDGGDSLSLIGSVDLSNHPVTEKIYESWLKNEDYFPVLSGEQLKSYYENLLSGLSLPSVPDWQDGLNEYGTFLPFSVGSLNTWSEAPYNDTEIKILKRFATIIDLTFRRYIELQKSEANAREAVKQAALDRVRAEIASMRTVSDLDRITPLIWNELTILGIPFIRCGVFIMDETQQLIHTFLSTPDGKAIAAFHLPYDTPGHFPDVIDHWRCKKIYVRRWSEDDFISIANTLVRQGAIATKEQYLRTLPKGGFYLHFLPFLQGLLYVGNTDQLGQEEIILIQHVADAFSTAYARYEDFNKLEAAKQQVDKTLVDLKQAQTQLVQSEKMASLGELTAGIAHEIQNPLNFVNNFSDVSNELLLEMKTELEKGNAKDAITIAEDVRQNLEKILHHGKRADAIVKGMLQHSRTSSGQKEPTDINALADEYLRLAYHGLRAKEKSFNAKFGTDFDQSIGKINIIPQEIGRVLLNLINNAFYAAPLLPEGGFKDPNHKHEPTVWVTTKKVGDKVLISVRDNGPGIPQKILDKIFQPFFTTKPTGQGTGLGLSLSYDIVKAHGGELRVETKEGEGSGFIIQLPVV